jgi:hypothetical protein
MSDSEQLENILDEALNMYRQAEPLAGLEERVLQRLRLQPEKDQTVWWKWGAVAACTALVLAALWIGVGDHRRRSSTVNQAVTQQQPVQTPNTKSNDDETSANQHRPHQEIVSRLAETRDKGLQAAHRDSQQRVARIETANSSGPKAAQFPLPAPLTPEEHSLLALAKSNPDALLDQSDRARELEIAPIEINALAGSDAPAPETNNE